MTRIRGLIAVLAVLVAAMVFPTLASATTKVKVTASVKAYVKLYCGWSSASFSTHEYIRTSFRMFVQATGSTKLRQKMVLHWLVRVADKAKAKVGVQCTYTPPPP